MIYNQLVKFPDMAVVKQKLYTDGIHDLSDALGSSLGPMPLKAKTNPGEQVAVAVGSRGIDRIDQVIYGCLQYLQDNGLKPFIVPAMGSHGGATDAGQRQVLAKLGITEASMGVPIHAEMDVDCIGRLENDVKIYFARRALAADHIVVINRIKPHTKFRAAIESGLCKMLTIGLGKADGAAEFHNKAIQHGFKIIEDAAAMVLERTKVLFGLGLLEDGYGKLSRLEPVWPFDLIESEKKLLKDVFSKMGRILIDDLDILIVDFIGKDISGIGMDSNVTGRHRDISGDFFIHPHIKRIFVRDLSPGSDGNANGIGLADITTKRLVEALDIDKTVTNALAAISPEKAAIPIHFDTDKEALQVCGHTVGLSGLSQARIVRIENTAALEYIQVSRALEAEIQSNPSLKQITPWGPLRFDSDGNLLPLRCEE